jgi:hypothetical protein
LILVRQAFNELAARATALINETYSAQGTQGTHGFGIFYDNGPQDPMPNQTPTGQQFGGYFADVGPAGFHYGLLNTETRIGASVGMGTHTMPGDVWWRTWRTLPRSFDWQGQPPQPVPPKLVTYRDPQSGKPFTIDEAHYSWPIGTGVQFVPSWGGSQFEALMDPLAIPEASWGPRSFGLNDLRYAQAQIIYATQTLGEWPQTRTAARMTSGRSRRTLPSLPCSSCRRMPCPTSSVFAACTRMCMGPTGFTMP